MKRINFGVFLLIWFLSTTLIGFIFRKILYNLDIEVSEKVYTIIIVSIFLISLIIMFNLFKKYSYNIGFNKIPNKRLNIIQSFFIALFISGILSFGYGSALTNMGYTVIVDNGSDKDINLSLNGNSIFLKKDSLYYYNGNKKTLTIEYSNFKNSYEPNGFNIFNIDSSRTYFKIEHLCGSLSFDDKLEPHKVIDTLKNKTFIELRDIDYILENAPEKISTTERPNFGEFIKRISLEKSENFKKYYKSEASGIE